MARSLCSFLYLYLFFLFTLISFTDRQHSHRNYVIKHPQTYAIYIYYKWECIHGNPVTLNVPYSFLIETASSKHTQSATTTTQTDGRKDKAQIRLGATQGTRNRFVLFYWNRSSFINSWKLNWMFRCLVSIVFFSSGERTLLLLYSLDRILNNPNIDRMIGKGRMTKEFNETGWRAK